MDESTIHNLSLTINLLCCLVGLMLLVMVWMATVVQGLKAGQAKLFMRYDTRPCDAHSVMVAALSETSKNHETRIQSLEQSRQHGQ
jgi:hypothetical protein